MGPTNLKYKAKRPYNHYQWFWQGPRLLGIIERHADGWHAFVGGRHDVGTAFPDRAAAAAFLTPLSS